MEKWLGLVRKSHKRHSKSEDIAQQQQQQQQQQQPERSPILNADQHEDPEISDSQDLDKYTVGIVCSRPIETAAAVGMLDEVHDKVQDQDALDHNSYILGSIHGHNIVIATLPAGQVGALAAADVSRDLLRTFKSVRFGLITGIGGGIPSRLHDIRLGDVVIGQPRGLYGGIVQFDHGTHTYDGFQRTGSFNSPPPLLLTALSSMQAEMEYENSLIPTYLAEMVVKRPKMRFEYIHQGIENDVLFESTYLHPGGGDCSQCDPRYAISRQVREDLEPRIHFGTIASSSSLIRDSQARDRLGMELGALCLDTEAAGLRGFPSIVIRGISSYSDSHFNKRWDRYAAATAAAVAKDLLRHVPSKMVRKANRIA